MKNTINELLRALMLIAFGGIMYFVLVAIAGALLGPLGVSYVDMDAVRAAIMAFVALAFIGAAMNNAAEKQTQKDFANEIAKAIQADRNAR